MATSSCSPSMWTINLLPVILDLPWINSKRNLTLNLNARTLEQQVTSWDSIYIEIGQKGSSTSPKNTTWRLYSIVLTYPIAILAKYLFLLDSDLSLLQMTNLP